MKMILDKPILFAVVGSSGSGKTTACEYISNQLSIPVLSSYTTRPMRLGEINGKQHIFTTPDKMPERNQMIAYTYFGGYHYWATRSQVDGQGAILYVIDEVGLEELIERFEKIYYIVPIYIECTSKPWVTSLDPDRLKRDEERHILDKKIYRAIVTNNGTLNDFLFRFREIITMLLNCPQVDIADWCRRQSGMPTLGELKRQWQQ